ncbi:MAG: tetratricopeptide repeat protein, partial [Spirochaetota bacterium]|nr:tetratricopeptide repeat protein [Spirochaetota bacterium]
KRLARFSENDPEPVMLYAYAAMRAGMEELALEGFRELTARLPSFAEGWNNLGVLLVRRGEYEAAARAFNQALEQMPGLEEARKNFDIIRNHRGRAGVPQ